MGCVVGVDRKSCDIGWNWLGVVSIGGALVLAALGVSTLFIRQLVNGAAGRVVTNVGG